MKNPRNMTELFSKLNDLKSIFVYGQKIIPVIQSLIDFMKDTVPLLENINKSIDESTKKIPTAKDQLHNVSSATEMATTEILDRVDEIYEDLNASQQIINEISEKYSAKKDAYEKLKEHLKGDKKAFELLNELMKNGISEQLETLTTKINDIQDKTYHITLSLQVQDITSQQLEAVHHLIESVQYRLSSLITDLEDTEFNELEKSYKSKEITFDADASYEHEKENQKVADNLFGGKQVENASQSEIDKLFSGAK